MKRLAVIAILVLAACSGERPAPGPQASAPTAPAGDAAQGKQLLDKYSCSGCHRVPGLEGPQGSLGPDLAGIATRPIGGRVKNDPQTMVAYLQNPPAVDPQTRMPPLGVSEEDARHIAAYLLTLR